MGRMQMRWSSPPAMASGLQGVCRAFAGRLQGACRAAAAVRMRGPRTSCGYEADECVVGSSVACIVAELRSSCDYGVLILANRRRVAMWLALHRGCSCRAPSSRSWPPSV